MAQSSYTNEIGGTVVVCSFCKCEVDNEGECCCDYENLVNACACSVCYATITCDMPCLYCPLGNQEEEENSDNDDNYFNSVGYIASYYSGIYSGGYWGFGYDGFGYYVPVTSVGTTSGTSSSTASFINAFVNTITLLVGLPYVYGANGPDSFDCSSTICYGLRQINSSFGDYTADQLFRLFTVPSSSYQRGTLVFYDYTSDGVIDHVTTLLDDGNMIHPSSGSGEILDVPASYLDNYTSSNGGTKYYREINWNSVNP